MSTFQASLGSLTSLIWIKVRGVTERAPESGSGHGRFYLCTWRIILHLLHLILWLPLRFLPRSRYLTSQKRYGRWNSRVERAVEHCSPGVQRCPCMVSIYLPRFPPALLTTTGKQSSFLPCRDHLHHHRFPQSFWNTLNVTLLFPDLTS